MLRPRHVVDDDAARRPHVVQARAGPGRTSSRPASWRCRANNFDQNTVYLNDGFIFEEQRQIDPNNPGRRDGAVPPAVHHRQPESAHRVRARQGHRLLRPGHLEADVAADGDAGRAGGPRAALRRAARILAAVEHRGRAAARLLVSADRRREERAAWHLRARARAAAGRRGIRRVVVRRRRRRRPSATPTTLDGDGTFEAVFDTPPRAGVGLRRCSSIPSCSQPIIDEFIARLPAAVPRAGERGRGRHRRKIHNSCSRRPTSTGSIPSGPEPAVRRLRRWSIRTRACVYRLTNNTWSADALPRAADDGGQEPVATTSRSMAAIHRQWQHDSGTWNPTDPARFIQPDAFPNNRMLWRTRRHRRTTTASHRQHAHRQPDVEPVLVPVQRRRGTAPAGTQSWRAATRWSRAGWSSLDHRSAAGQQPASSRSFGPATVVSSTGVGAVEPAVGRASASSTRPAGRGRSAGRRRPHGGTQAQQAVQAGRGARRSSCRANILQPAQRRRGTEYARGGREPASTTPRQLPDQPGNPAGGAVASSWKRSCSGSDDGERLSVADECTSESPRSRVDTLAIAARAAGALVMRDGSAHGCAAAARAGGAQPTPLSEARRTSGWSATTTCRAAQRCVTTTKSDPANGNWVVRRPSRSVPATAKTADESDHRAGGDQRHVDPRHHRSGQADDHVWHIPNETNRNSRSTSVVYDYKFDWIGPRLSDPQLRGAHQGETGLT